MFRVSYQCPGKVLIRLASSTLWCGWRAWRRYLEHAHVASMRAALTQQKQRTAMMVMSRWRMRSQQPVFMAWKQYVHARRHSTQQRHVVLQRVMERIRCGDLTHAWFRWSCHAQHGAYCADVRHRYESEMSQTFDVISLENEALRNTLTQQVSRRRRRRNSYVHTRSLGCAFHV